LAARGVRCAVRATTAVVPCRSMNVLSFDSFGAPDVLRYRPHPDPTPGPASCRASTGKVLLIP